MSEKSSMMRPSHASSQSAPRALAYSTSDGARLSHVAGSSCGGPPAQALVRVSACRVRRQGSGRALGQRRTTRLGLEAKASEGKGEGSALSG